MMHRIRAEDIARLLDIASIKSKLSVVNAFENNPSPSL